MTPRRYHATMASRVAEAFAALVYVAAADGRADTILAAYRSILDRLETDPTGCGEARENLPAMQVRTRIAFEGPLVVRFAVHQAEPFVWIQSIAARRPGRR